MLPGLSTLLWFFDSCSMKGSEKSFQVFLTFQSASFAFVAPSAVSRMFNSSSDHHHKLVKKIIKYITKTFLYQRVHFHASFSLNQ